MTRHNTLLLDVIVGQVSGSTPRRVLEQLLEQGLLNIRNCERLAILANIEILIDKGMGRCDAFQSTAEEFCCSYEKVREIFYKQYKP